MCNTMLGPVFLLFFYFVFFSSVIYKQIIKACRNNIDLRNTSEWDFVCLNWWNLLMLLISCDTLPASFTSFNTLLLHPPPPPTLCPLYNLMQWMIHRSWQNNACCSFLNRFALCPLPRHTVYYVPGFVLRLLTFVLIMLLCILNPWNVLPMNYEMTDTWESLPTHPP